MRPEATDIKKSGARTAPAAFIPFHSLASGTDMFSDFGKLSLLLFQRSVFQVSGSRDIDYILDAARKRNSISPGIASQLTGIWAPIHTLLPEYELMGQYMKGTWQTDKLLENVVQKASFPERAQALSQELVRECPPWLPIGTNKMYPLLVDGAAAWMILCARDPISMVCNPLQAEAIGLIFSSIGKHPKECFRQIFSWKVPDLTGISWERIFELRNTPLRTSSRQDRRGPTAIEPGTCSNRGG